MSVPIRLIIAFALGCFIGWIGQAYHIPVILTWTVAFLVGFYLDNILNLFKKDKS